MAPDHRHTDLLQVTVMLNANILILQMHRSSLGDKSTPAHLFMLRQAVELLHCLQDIEESADAESEEDNSYMVLVDGGVHPLLAARATDTSSAEAFVLAWALLLACMLDADRDHRRRLGLMCGTVDG